MKHANAHMDQPISPRVVPRYQIQCVEMIRRSTCLDLASVEGTTPNHTDTAPIRDLLFQNFKNTKKTL